MHSIPTEYQLSTAETSRQLDSATIKEFGIDGYTLMEVAGSRMADSFFRANPGVQHNLVVCGKGNNAGDGLVLARYMMQHGHSVTVLFVSGTDDLSPDTTKNYELLQQIKNHEADYPGELTFINGWKPEELTAEYDGIIDAMLGTGLDSNVRGNYTDAVHWINKQFSAVYAVDIPTGLNSDTGKIMGVAVRADMTFTFGTRKLGFYINKGPEMTGEVIYCELPFPRHYRNETGRYVMDYNWMDDFSHEQSLHLAGTLSGASHKYEAGILYLIAGSEGLTGAAIMAARSAWAEGIGAVMLIAPRGIVSVFETILPQIIKKPVGSRDDYYFRKSHLEEIKAIIAEKPGTVLIGPGLGRKAETAAFVQEFIQTTTADTVADADALWALARLNRISHSGGELVLTPHPGELGEFIEFDKNNQFDRLIKTETFAQMNNLTILSKGYPGIITGHDSLTYITDYNTTIFSRAGFGDVLAGKVSALMVKGASPTVACLLALWLGYKKAFEVKADYLEPIHLI